MPRDERGLTPKQAAFVDAYKGNATEAALAAGYSAHTAAFIGAENLKKPQILECIKNRQDSESRSRIATRHERQAFWTEVMQNANEEMSARLRASELLGKSECDFIERHEMTGANGAALAAPILQISFVHGKEKPDG